MGPTASCAAYEIYKGLNNTKKDKFTVAIPAGVHLESVVSELLLNTATSNATRKLCLNNLQYDVGSSLWVQMNVQVTL